ncbi:MAG TPA: DUF4397 domain-containing protein [Gemmatimonadaceae bacterium]|jgi:hypothetical protein|nr:DUF4397 domain-containing protein [Gemmatimonadaceae bacterium]
MTVSRWAGVVVGVSALVVGACGGSRNPLATPAETQFNFHTASIGLGNWPCGCSYVPYDFIYIDQFDTTRTDDPYFNGAFDSYPIDPNAHSGIPLFERIEYMREAAGAHRFRFTNFNHGVVVDTTLALAASANTVIYLTDSIGVRYHVMLVDESTPGPANSVRMRVLNLSPDAGPVSAYVVASSGTFLWSNLPQQVAYGTISPYVTVDPSVVASDGNVYLKFFGGTDTAQTVAAATVPFTPGRSYHVVVEGLVSPHVVSYPGAVSVTVNPSVTAHVRVAH